MRKALVIGIDFYSQIGCLSGCVKDAYSVKSMLERHEDGSKNFGVRLMTSESDTCPVTRNGVRDAVRDLFTDSPDIALLYFAGHGFIDEAGGYLCASDCTAGHDGLALGEIMSLANQSKARNKIIILDSCHSGIVASHHSSPGLSEIQEGVTILTASTDKQYALGGEAGGVFTNLFVDALNGAAANLLGDITPGSVYAHIDQSLWEWGQRPVFKTNVKSFISLRKTSAPVPLPELRKLTDIFPSPSTRLSLDPSFEPERNAEQRNDPTFPEPDDKNTAMFALLQKYAKINLVRPVGEEHMWHAAINSKSCELTVLGIHYWNLVNNDLI